MSLRAEPVICLLLVLTTLAGCLGSDTPTETPDTDGSALTSVFERNLLPFNVTSSYSHTLAGGLYNILEPLSIDVPVALPLDEGGAAITQDAKVHMGLWLPDVPEGTKVPVVADIGPYYSDGDVDATTPARRLGGFLIENLVPQGYAVAQVSVFGTGQANHCMDLMGLSEQLGIDAAVTYLGTQDWSNGNVGLIGRSYDGSTPWQAAMFGNEHLKTIVPISGLIGMHELMWRNGSAEFRGPIMHNVVYGTFGIDSADVNAFAILGGDATKAVTVNEFDEDDLDTLCKDYALGPAVGAAAYATGDWAAPEVNDYWKERYFLDRALANYKGSVYFIHGLQDWNVDPHMAFPAYQQLQGKGIEVKGLFGQWNHMYPDRPSEHVNAGEGRGREAFPESVRFDWAQDLLEWFDHYLMGTGTKPPLHAEVQDNQGAWRIEATYPPTDATWNLIKLSEGELVQGAGPTGDPVVKPASNTLGFEESGEPVVYTFPGFDNDTRIVGTPRFHATVTPTGPGGQLFAELVDKTDGLRLGHAVMDLRFADGGNTMKPVTPGKAIVAKMEFEAFDVLLPAGHELELRISATGEDYLPAAVSDPVIIDPAESVLKLSTIERGAEAFFTPPAWDVCTHPDMVSRAGNNENFAKRLNEDHGCAF
ncbi:MAG: CocE/NonD family hydrolase [Euryarchaeota archaeon]|nr:CocE/NonD family hydrolase [Euryarchaeota archaeon]